MGRLGGGEQGYGSDADVLFVHEPLRGRRPGGRRGRPRRRQRAAPAAGPARARPAAARRRRPAARGQAGAAVPQPRVLRRLLRPLVARVGGAGAAAGRAAGRRRRTSRRRSWTHVGAGALPRGRARPRSRCARSRRIKARVEAERVPRGVDRAAGTQARPGRHRRRRVDRAAAAAAARRARCRACAPPGPCAALDAARDAGLLEADDADGPASAPGPGDAGCATSPCWSAARPRGSCRQRPGARPARPRARLPAGRARRAARGLPAGHPAGPRGGRAGLLRREQPGTDRAGAVPRAPTCAPSWPPTPASCCASAGAGRRRAGAAAARRPGDLDAAGATSRRGSPTGRRVLAPDLPGLGGSAYAGPYDVPSPGPPARRTGRAGGPAGRSTSSGTTGAGAGARAWPGPGPTSSAGWCVVNAPYRTLAAARAPCTCRSSRCRVLPELLFRVAGRRVVETRCSRSAWRAAPLLDADVLAEYAAAYSHARRVRAMLGYYRAAARPVRPRAGRAAARRRPRAGRVGAPVAAPSRCWCCGAPRTRCCRSASGRPSCATSAPTR